MDQIQTALNISRAEIGAVGMLLVNQGLTAHSVPMGSFGLNSSGQAEAERLGVLVPMTDPPAPSSIHINANYSVVQIAGSNSSQSGTLNANHSMIQQVLSEIERTLPSLNLEPAAREEAAGLLSTLKTQLHNLPGAAGRAIAAALASLLKAGGSDLGHALIKHFGIET
jgi:hypothetical protein